MATAFPIMGDLEPALGREVFLGPARVLELLGATPRVELPDGTRVRAEAALAFPYAPAVGDELLVIGKGDRHYIIGVLKAGGEVTLRFQGNVDLHAVGGALRLRGDREVSVDAPRTDIRTGRLEVIADSVVERLGSLYQRVKESVRLHAGDRLDLIDRDWHSRAERMSVTTRGTVAINGKEVHLG